jgi:YtkA-like
MTNRTALFAGLCFVFACTNAPTQEGPLVPVTQATSVDGAYSFSLLAPETVTRGNYVLQYVITSTATGSAVDDLDLDIVPWMPAMGHGTSQVPTITGLGGGTYELDDVDLYMPGLWQLRTTSSGNQLVAPSLQVQ